MIKLSGLIRSTYRRKTLLFVSLFTAFFTVAIVAVFVLQDLDHKKMDDERTTAAVSRMLSQVMRLPLYAGDRKQLLQLADNAVKTFGISKVRILLPDGTQYLEYPNVKVPPQTISSSTPIGMEQSLSPAAAITGEADGEIPLGTVVAYSTGKDRQHELYMASAYLMMAGALFWLITTYVAYLIMRKLTASFDALISAIKEIEQGTSDAIRVPLADEAGYIAQRINGLTQTLHERERQNLALQQELTRQMEKRAETAEQTMQAKLIHADKMASLGMLVGCMGHEINNPNAMIRLQTENIRQIVTDARPIIMAQGEEEGMFYLGGMPYLEADKALFDSINGIHQQTARIERVISELRQYATADSNEKKPICLEMSINGTMVLLNPEIKRYPGNIEIRVQSGVRRSYESSDRYDGEDRRAKIFANQFSLQQVIVNLLSNAIRATSHRGGEGRIIVDIQSKPGAVELIIEDNGVGIHPDDIPKLCDPYFSRHLDSDGTGLGLFISNQIISEHNGTMEFRSVLGEGTAVHITFPAIRSSKYD